MAVFESTPFRLTSSVYFRIAVRQKLPKVALSLALPFLILLAAGAIFDSRMLFIALMIPFIFTPVVMSHIYYSTLLQPEARRALSLQQAIVESGMKITLAFLKTENKPTEKENEGELREHTHKESNQPFLSATGSNSDTKAEELVKVGETIYSWNSISEISLFSRNLVIWLVDVSLPVVIPLSAMPADFDPYSIETVPERIENYDNALRHK